MHHPEKVLYKSPLPAKIVTIVFYKYWEYSGTKKYAFKESSQRHVHVD